MAVLDVSAPASARPRPHLLAHVLAHPLAHSLGWYLASRLLVLVVAGLAVLVHSDVSGSRLVSAWDARYYLSIIDHGYPSVVPEIDGQAGLTPLAFFPLFPALAAAVAWLSHVPNAVAAIAVSLAFGALATVLVSRLAARLTDEGTARRVTVLFCLFPGSAVFSIGYSESLMIVLVAGCLLALLDHRWLLAGVAAGLATATRPNAAGLVIACAAASAVAIRSRRDWRSLAAPLLAPVGIAGFLAFVDWYTGERGVWFRIQREAWGQEFDFGVNTAKTAWNFVIDPFVDPRQIVVMVLLGFTVAATAVFMSRRWPLPVTIYTLSVVALSIGSTIDIVRPRAILTAFPLLIGLGVSFDRRAWALLATLSGAGLAALVFFPFWAAP